MGANHRKCCCDEASPCSNCSGTATPISWTVTISGTTLPGTIVCGGRTYTITGNVNGTYTVPQVEPVGTCGACYWTYDLSANGFISFHDDTGNFYLTIYLIVIRGFGGSATNRVAIGTFESDCSWGHEMLQRAEAVNCLTAISGASTTSTSCGGSSGMIRYSIGGSVSATPNF